MKGFIKVCLIIAALLLIVGAIGFFGLGFYLSPQSHLTKSDAIVAISGGETDSRALEAIGLYEQGWAPHIIFSGAALDSNGPSNARAMRQLALSRGVPENVITLDETSINTDQNAAGVASVVKQNQYHKIILVTSPYHQRRASLAFRVALPNDVIILNHSTTDKSWRRAEWWANSYSRQLTFSELQKVMYVLLVERKQ